MTENNDLILCLWDIETINTMEPPFDCSDLAVAERFGMAVGVVRWEHYRRNPSTREVSRWTLAENTHFSAVALLDDLMRPWHDAHVAYNGLAFDLPVAVAAAVPEIPGPYLHSSDPALVAAVSRMMSLIQAQGHPVVAFQDAMLDLEPPASRWQRFRYDFIRKHLMGLACGADTRNILGRWMGMQSEHSQLVPAGVVGLNWTRERLLENLSARCFDPLAELGQATGHPHVAKLDYLREGLGLDPFTIDGVEPDHALLPQWWADGRVWEVVETCRADVSVLAELMHQALGGTKPRIFANRLNSKRRDGTVVDLRAFESPHHGKGGKWRFHIPTKAWWGACEARSPRLGATL